MKIESMDASNFTSPVNSEMRQKQIESNSNFQTSNSANKTTIIDSKKITQLSDYEKKELPISEKILIDAIEKANKAISGSNRKLEYSVHEKTKEIMVKVINSDTNEVVREFPPEKILDMIAKMWEMAGLMVDERR